MPITSKRLVEAITKSLPILKKIPDDLEPLLERMLTKDGGVIDRERFNIILSTWKIEPANRYFFTYYFTDSIDSTDKFIDGLHKFMRDALWHFGDIRRGFSVLSRIDDINSYIKNMNLT